MLNRTLPSQTYRYRTFRMPAGPHEHTCRCSTAPSPACAPSAARSHQHRTPTRPRPKARARGVRLPSHSQTASLDAPRHPNLAQHCVAVGSLVLVEQSAHFFFLSSFLSSFLVSISSKYFHRMVKSIAETPLVISFVPRPRRKSPCMPSSETMTEMVAM